MIINSQRTMYAIDLQMNMILGRPHKSLINTTLNEKFNILPLEDVPENAYPKLDYLVIGIGGTEMVDGTPYMFSKHQAIDAALFQHVPYIMRTIDDDLLPEERNNYRLRTLETINGIEYIVYYMKKITNYVCRDNLFEVTSKNDIHILTPMNTNTYELLNPVPRLVENYLDYNDRKYFAKTVKVEFALSSEDMQNIEEAMMIKFGKITPISEIGLCSGIDVDNNGITESTNVLINYFVEVNIDTTMYLLNNDSILRNIEIGSLELMIR